MPFIGLILDCRTPNLMELAAGLPRDITHMGERYRYVERLLSNPHIDVDEVSGGYAKPVLERLCENGETIVLMMGQSHINAMERSLDAFDPCGTTVSASKAI